MKKKLLFGFLILTLVAVPLFSSACAKEKLTEKVELKLATFLPPFAARMVAYQEWADKIAEQTEGMVTVTLYPASTLLAPPDMISGVKSGIADIGEITLGGNVDLYPLSNILVLPFLGIGDTKDAYNIWMTLQDEFPEMEAEFKDFKIVFASGSGGEAFALHTTEKAVRVPTEMKGIKIQAEGGMVQVMDELGAAPVLASAPEWYTDLQTGIIEGMWMNWMAVGEMGLLDFLKYHTTFPSGYMFGEMQMIMNLDSWNSLPDYVQDIIDDLRPWMEERIFELDAGANAKGLQAAQDAGGHTFITLTPDEENQWYEVAYPLHLEYLAELDAKGLPATEVYERARELSAKNK